LTDWFLCRPQRLGAAELKCRRRFLLTRMRGEVGKLRAGAVERQPGAGELPTARSL